MTCHSMGIAIEQKKQFSLKKKYLTHIISKGRTKAIIYAKVSYKSSMFKSFGVSRLTSTFDLSTPKMIIQHKKIWFNLSSFDYSFTIFNYHLYKSAAVLLNGEVVRKCQKCRTGPFRRHLFPGGQGCSNNNNESNSLQLQWATYHFQGICMAFCHSMDWHSNFYIASLGATAPSLHNLKFSSSQQIRNLPVLTLHW